MRMAQELLSHWPEIRERIGKKNMALLLDYDGTLTPIVKTPAQAKLSPDAKKQLAALARQVSLFAVVSGRKLSDIKAKVKIAAIGYVGNHGLEIEYRGRSFKGIVPQDFPLTLKQIKGLLGEKLQNVKGIVFEDKGVILSLHYRQVKSNEVSKVKRVFSQTLEDYRKSNKVRIATGKKVLEIRPPVDWDKGKAVSWLLHSCGIRNVFPIYVGDDKTDEDAFGALSGLGLTVAVGKKRNTKAEYYVKNSKEVYTFLEELKAFLKERKRKIYAHRIKTSERTF